MTPEICVQSLQTCREFFNRSSRCLTEEDSTFSPAEGVITTAQVVAHVAQTIDWFVEGAFRPEGFDLDFESHWNEVHPVTSLTEARAWLDRSFDQAIEVFGSKNTEELTQPLPAGLIMGGAPRFAVIGAIEDHTAHHRGALTVYSRLCGHVPTMPYMDDETAG